MVSLVDDIREERWNQVEKRVKGLRNVERIGNAFHLAAKNPDVPLNIIKLFFAQLIQNDPHLSNSEDNREAFECFLFIKIFREPTAYRYDWLELILGASPETLEEIFTTVRGMNNGLPPPQQGSISGAIWILWRDFLISGNHVRSLHRDRKLTLGASEDAQQLLLNIESVDDFEESSPLGAVWNKSLILVKYAHAQKECRDDCLLLKMVRLQVPAIVVWLGCRCFPTDLTIRDTRGRLPVHYALELGCNTNRDSMVLHVSFSSNILTSATNKTLLNVLLSACPQATQYALPDGSLPLSHLLSSTGSGHNRTPLEDIEALICAEPRALATRNVQTHFFPFMEAAATNDSTIIYSLLRSNPAVVGTCIKPNVNELYLKGKLAKAEAKLAELASENKTLLDKTKALKETIQALTKENAVLKSSGGKGTKRNAKCS